MKKLIILVLALGMMACTQKEKADLLVFNANIYTVNEAFDTAEAMVVTNGNVVALGSTEELQAKYDAENQYDAEGNTVLPGFYDAHCHFNGLGFALQQVNLRGTTSYEEVIQRIVDFQSEKNLSFIAGRGWDQNDWEVKKFPTKEKLDEAFPDTPVVVRREKLDEAFPDTPVVVRRVDGHALLANSAAMALAGVTVDSSKEGGDIIIENGELTGVFIDGPMRFFGGIAPDSTLDEQVMALTDAEKTCFSYGLTTVNDAGLGRHTIELIDSLQQSGELKIRVYAMVSVSDKSIDYYTNKGIIKTDRLNVRSFKVYADGALGSRGATMKAPYADKPMHYGAMVTPVEKLEDYAKKIAASDYQMNTHAIGDSANYVMLKTYKEVLKGEKDRRWKIEHAQIIDQPDFDYFGNIVPSVQPTHATSDMYWAEDRIGPERMKGAYAFKDLLNQYGQVALGTDFPVEKVNPFHTFYAAVARKDLDQYPDGGFQMENALTREETLKGMTIWAAHSNFEEQERGSLEPGKLADFIVLDQNIMEIEVDAIPNTSVLRTYVSGERVF